jgi:DNA-directed RNA polymerase specialized sigma24 family protein
VQDVLVSGSDQKELERLYREQGDRMWRAVLAFAGDPEVAKDAVAEAFAQALSRVG